MKDINVKEQVDLLINASTEVIDKTQSWNIIYVNTPTGIMKIKSHLTGAEWLAAQNLRLKNQPKKTKKRK